jgi:hypothetical protein
MLASLQTLQRVRDRLTNAVPLEDGSGGIVRDGVAGATSTQHGRYSPYDRHDRYSRFFPHERNSFPPATDCDRENSELTQTSNPATGSSMEEFA